MDRPEDLPYLLRKIEPALPIEITASRGAAAVLRSIGPLLFVKIRKAGLIALEIGRRWGSLSRCSDQARQRTCGGAS
jgi:hypothetical protein